MALGNQPHIITVQYLSSAGLGKTAPERVCEWGSASQIRIGRLAVAEGPLPDSVSGQVTSVAADLGSPLGPKKRQPVTGRGILSWRPSVATKIWAALLLTATAQHGVRHRVPETDAADQPPPDPSAVSTDRGLLGSLGRPCQTEVSSCSSSRRHPRWICRRDWVSLAPPARSESAATSHRWNGMDGEQWAMRLK